MTNGENNAFPVVLQHGLTHDCHVEIGLTKREYFAAMAMQGLMMGSGFSYKPSDTANYAVDYADAILAELEKTKTT